MKYNYVNVESIKVGTIGYELEKLPLSIRNAGGDHDTNEDQVVLWELYNHTLPRGQTIGSVHDEFKKKNQEVKAIGKCLLANLAQFANERNKKYIYVRGAKLQAWGFYKYMGFLPLGTNVLNWFTETETLISKTRGAEIIVRSMAKNANAARASLSQWDTMILSLARNPEGNSGDALEDPKDPRTHEGVTINHDGGFMKFNYPDI